MSGGALPLEMRVLGLLMTSHGLADLDVPRIASVLNAPRIHVAAAVDRLIADGLAACTARDGGCDLVTVSGDFVPEASACSRLGTVVQFPVAAGDVPESAA